MNDYGIWTYVPSCPGLPSATEGREQRSMAARAGNIHVTIASKMMHAARRSMREKEKKMLTISFFRDTPT